MKPKPSGCEGCPAQGVGKSYVPGEGPREATIALVGQGPGKVEAALGRPFIGPSGEELDRWLAAAGILRRSVWVDNIVRCALPKDRPPTVAETKHCQGAHWGPALAELPHLKVVVPVGVPAAKALCDKHFTDKHAGTVYTINLEDQRSD